jgi:hypothetical protein
MTNSDSCPQTKYAGPCNEAVEHGDDYRILYNGFEVATLSYCEDYCWAQLYAERNRLMRPTVKLSVASHKPWRTRAMNAQTVFDRAREVYRDG